MKVDGGLGPTLSHDLNSFGASARELQDAGYGGIWSAETNHDPFFPLLLAARSTTEVDLGTAIAVAFARSPMTLATTANDLQAFTGGRFILGLGTQIRPHIEKRFSMPWSHPAARMREFVAALHAIWSAWSDGTALGFEGDFYTHKIMTPMFTPEPQPYPAPKIFLAAVGEVMTEMCGGVGGGRVALP